MTLIDHEVCLTESEQALIEEYGSTNLDFIKAVRTENRQTDAIERAIVLIMTHPDINMFEMESLDLVNSLRTLNRRNR